MTVAVLAATLLVFIARSAVSDSPSPCTLPVTTGRCDAIIPRYAYYKDQGECREFMYGGCGGNANNFQTLNDCQVACLPNRNTREVVEESSDKPVKDEANNPVEATSIANCSEAVAANANGPAEVTTTNANRPVEAVTASNANDTSIQTESEVQHEISEEKKCPARCPNYFYISHYEELGCEAIFDDSDKCCPARYNCSSRGELDSDKCYYKGRTYNMNEDLPEDTSHPCSVHCSCRQSYFDNMASITCASVECAELFMGPLTEPNCVRQYEGNSCCSTNKFCTKENTTIEEAEGVLKCVYQGKTYIEGQRFYPKEEPCMTCLCQAGFTADEFNTASNETALTDKTAPSEDDCVFGDLRISKGESLPASIAKDCVTCSCAIPPVPTCVKNYNKCAPAPPPADNPDEII
ncbi:hypothetical protein B566_EDAN003604 [Ephemera danica]|nr:hypothetical protein B566_EDAN003604 [Ephemera danica]